MSATVEQVFDPLFSQGYAKAPLYVEHQGELYEVNSYIISVEPGEYAGSTATWTSAVTIRLRTGLPVDEAAEKIDLAGTQPGE